MRIKPRQLFAILGGNEYVGELWVIINSHSHSYDVLRLSDKIKTPLPHNVPQEILKNGVKRGYVDYVETLPKKIFQTFYTQWETSQKIS